MSYFITGTDTEIGKTLVATALIYALKNKGLNVACMKPVAAGAEYIDGMWHNEDVDALLAVSTIKFPQEQVCPYLLKSPIAPHIAAQDEGVSLDLRVILKEFRNIRAQTDVVVVEGVGGFCVPLNGHLDMSDLVFQLDLPIILVVGMRLGCLNHGVLTIEAINRRGLVIAGWVANTLDAKMPRYEENIASLKVRINAPFLGAIPRLDVPSPEAVWHHLDFSALT